ncbi:MAG: site-specific DNA-methyltransferase [bacterium]|nr:site-specific DNA-methyltransferase [bacterium]
MNPHYDDGDVTVYHGDCLDVLRGLPDASVDAVVTDPPYGLEFMGKEWDSYSFAPADMVKRFRPGWEHAQSGAGIARDPSTPQGRTGVSFHKRRSTYKCGRCGKRDAFKNRQQCGGSSDHDWQHEWVDEQPVEMLAFQQWCQLWAAECLRVLRPGGHLLAFGGTRTYHRMACAIEDAGFEIRDSIHWTYGSGFPKSLDVSKAIDKAAGATREKVRVPPRPATSGTMAGSTDTRPWIEKSREVGYHEVDGGATDAARQWDGWGTALKPSHEPIVVARKPLVGTVAGNVLAHGTGAINVDGCRIGTEDSLKGGRYAAHLPDLPDGDTYGSGINRRSSQEFVQPTGRWPANTILTHAPDCDPDGGCGAGCPCAEMDAQSGVSTSVGVAAFKPRSVYNADAEGYDISGTEIGYGDTGGASRFFPAFYYTAKASSAERPRGDGVAHPTVKPLDLMRWLVRLVTPPGGVVLEPFAGSGTTAEACVVEGFRCIAIEREADYLPLIEARLSKPIERTLL